MMFGHNVNESRGQSRSLFIKCCWRMTQRVKCPGEGKETFLCHHAHPGLRSRRIVGGRCLVLALSGGLCSPGDGSTLVVDLARLSLALFLFIPAGGGICPTRYRTAAL